MQGNLTPLRMLPTWLPDAVRLYLDHTEDGLSLRALARRDGCHASTVMRTVRRYERRREDPLMDEALEPEVQAEILRTLEGFAHATIRFDHLTTRKAGQRRFVDLHMHMPADWTLRRASALRTSVEQALMAAVPGLRATIQLLPSDVEAHFGDAVDPR